MEMESVDLASEPVNGNWEVYKDAFAPPQPSRTLKAWERTAVPALAPRLQGQKIWKRAAVKSQRAHYKENFDAAQKELEKEEKGSRKRMRVRSGNENIGNAPWKEDMAADSGFNGDILDNTVTDSVKNGDATVFPLSDAGANALQFVPRKRTNTNHVITPRKPLRQTTINILSHSQDFTKSLQPSPDKPVRRRKSIRKSVAGGFPRVPEVAGEEKSTDSEYVTQVVQAENAAEKMPAPFVKDASTNSEPVTTVLQPDFSTEGSPVPSQALLKIEESATKSSLNERLHKLFDLANDEQPTHEELDQTSRDKGVHLIKVPLNCLEVALEDMTGQSRANAFGDNESKSALETGESRGRKSPKTDNVIIDSIETDLEVQPAKTNNTSRNKRGTSQQRETRRSTRTTRASSVRAEAHVPETKEDRPAPEESTSNLLENIANFAEENSAQPAYKPTENEALAIHSEETEDSDRTLTNESISTATLPEQESTMPKSEGLVQNFVTRLESQHTGGGYAKNSEELNCTELESSDITIQPTLEILVPGPQRSMPNEDFELLPVSFSTEAMPSDNVQIEETQEDVSNFKTDLPSPANSFSEKHSSSARFSPAGEETNPQFTCNPEELTDDILETLEPISILADSENLTNENEKLSPLVEDHRGTSTPNHTTIELVDDITENAPQAPYDHDDTDMLRNFLTRVKANKAAKAGTGIPKRKRSLPHSPLGLPLGDAINAFSPSPLKAKDEFDVGLPGPSPSKRRKRNEPVIVEEDDTITDARPTRRSGRTRLPVIKAPLGAPSHIPVRRLGQDGDTTVTLKRSEEKELAALTRVNTRKNKGVSQSVFEVLARKAEEKEDPVLRQRLLKELFDEKAKNGKEKKAKTVIWAEELTQYQTMEGNKLDGEKEKGRDAENAAPAEEKKSAVKMGVRSKIALGMAANGTPAPKRKRVRS